MKELTKIPNRRDALKYKHCLIDALDEAEVGYKMEVVEHYEAQYSEVVVTVNNEDFEKAHKAMQELIKKGEPK